MTKRYFWLVLAFLVVANLLWAAQPPKFVSMVQLISAPERFDGQLISVIGFLTLGNERSNLYLHEADAIHEIAENSVTIETNDEVNRNRKSLDGKYVRIVGVFSSGKSTPFSIGGINSIVSCDYWSEVGRPRGQRLGKIPGIAPQ